MRAAGSGLKAAINTFFEGNPDEWLTIDDAVLKWAATRKQIQDAVANIKRDGGIVRSDNGVIETIWTQRAK